MTRQTCCLEGTSGTGGTAEVSCGSSGSSRGLAGLNTRRLPPAVLGHQWNLMDY